MSLYYQNLANILRYLHDKMSFAEKSAFESEMQQNSELKEEVEFDSLLVDMLKKEKHEKMKALLLKKVAEENKTSAKTIPLWNTKYFAAIAAAALVLIVIVFALWERKPPILEEHLTDKDSANKKSHIVEQDTFVKQPENVIPLDTVSAKNGFVSKEKEKKTVSPTPQPIPPKPKPKFNLEEYNERIAFTNPTLNPLVSSSDEEDDIAKSDSLMALKQYAAALDVLNKSEEKDTDTDIWYLLGECYYYTQDFENANIYLRKVLPLGGRNAARARWYLSLISIQKNQNKLANKQLDTFFLYRDLLMKRDSVYLQKANKLKEEIKKQ